MKYWVDPPSGWQYGFPKVWDSQADPNLDEWLHAQGYPDAREALYVRTWPYEEEVDNE